MGPFRWSGPSANAPAVIINARIGDETEPIQALANSLAIPENWVGSIRYMVDLLNSWPGDNNEAVMRTPRW